MMTLLKTNLRASPHQFWSFPLAWGWVCGGAGGGLRLWRGSIPAGEWLLKFAHPRCSIYRFQFLLSLPQQLLPSHIPFRALLAVVVRIQCNRREVSVCVAFSRSALHAHASASVKNVRRPCAYGAFLTQDNPRVQTER
jgi:hypothetical protein